jgi:membrane-bound lytic murein transglycosylase B
MRYLPLIPALILTACASTTTVQASEQASERLQTTAVTQTEPSRAEQFQTYKTDLAARAIAKGYDADLVAKTIGAARYYERTISRDSNQPEFTRPVWSYIQSAASADRITRGRAEMSEHTDTLQAVQQTYGVPDYILTSIWGLETSYGRIMGDFELFTTLATLGFDGRRRNWAESQMFAALDLLTKGEVRQEQLRGAWAGAMGMTQFIPTTFRDYAVDFDRDGNKDLWTSEADALASAAHYLARSGWRSGEPVMAEVTVPDDFDYSLTETVSKSINDWTALGVAPANGMRWGRSAGFLEAKMLVPGGHKGPKILVFKNFDVLKRYNNSTSYVMGIASLGEALRGRQAIRNPWPESDKPLSFEDKKRLQEALSAQGYSTGGVDGQIGPNSRRAIRAWQRANGVPADGYVEQTLFKRILASG